MSPCIRPQALLFDFYNTLLNIRTKEDDPKVWTQLARFLSYQGLRTDPAALHATYLTHIQDMQHASGERYPEIDMVGVFRTLLIDVGYTGHEHFCVQLTQLFRALSMRRFRAFPDTLPALQTLGSSFKLGLVSDAQRIFLDPEMAQIGVLDLFDVRIVSSDYGFRKPDPRLFAMALEQLDVAAQDALYIGDNIFRDVCGAQSVGMPGVLLKRHNHQEEAGRNCTPDLIFDSLDTLVAWLSD